MAKKRVNTRGRTWVALILLSFVLVAAGVIKRRALGVTQGREIRRLEEQLQALESRKKRVEEGIEAARHLDRLGPVVEQRLGLRTPHDSMIHIIHRATR